MSKELLIPIIQFYAMQFNIDTNVALAVAEVESSYNTRAVGAVGEVGLYQIRPKYSVVTKQELFNPSLNIMLGIRKLREAKNQCIHQKNLTWLTCYNRGVNGAKKVKNPEKDQYVLKVKNIIERNNKK